MSKQNNNASETPEEFRGLHRVLLFVAAFFFFYLIVEAVILIPGLFMRYGMH